jgi:hypothetical protein
MLSGGHVSGWQVRGTMTAPSTHGICSIDLDRSPGRDDWLTVALGAERLVPVRTDFEPEDGPLAVVIPLGPPPSDAALSLLARLIAEGALESPDRGWTDVPTRQWAVTAWGRIIAAVTGLREDAATGLRRRPR